MNSEQSVAIVTASYAPDFERCRMLCQSIDQHVSGFTNHYLLVEAADVALFKVLEGPNRKVIDERELLPSWLKAYSDPFSFGRRRVWLSLKTPPLRGWHTQQLRRMCIAKHRDEAAFFYCDSDTLFIRDFDVSKIWRGNSLRLFRRDHALAQHAGDSNQVVWAHNAAQILGLNELDVSEHDYIGTLIAWRRDTMLALCAHIEAITGKHWVSAVASRRRFSECMIYGQFADSFGKLVGHHLDNREYCQMFWIDPMPTRDEFMHILRNMDAQKVAIGIQSFMNADLTEIRQWVALAKLT